MMELIRKIMNFLRALPAFSGVIDKALKTGKIDAIDTLGALTTISPSTKKITDVAMQTAQNGGNIADVAREISNLGEVEVMGQKLNMQTLTRDLKQAGGICSMLGGIIEKMPTQSAQEVASFGDKASYVSNWKDVVIS